MSSYAGYAIVNFVSGGKSERPIILVLGSINLLIGFSIYQRTFPSLRSSWFLIIFDQKFCGGDVKQVQAIERNRYGSNVADGRGIWQFKGQVYDRIGVGHRLQETYKANKWSLMLSSLADPSTGVSTGRALARAQDEHRTKHSWSC
ncbi:hypothetical protein OS493_014561 [Desmophyllum pertusum]|uniref:Uncharacterized protein n=1 Tax=Desmophyllum pertusum TaxID=174260 RepID=A0A9X0CL25_9CNID|nr:hypothetical protein OS493_014561 [Desmophyllum pertusum]